MKPLFAVTLIVGFGILALSCASAPEATAPAGNTAASIEGVWRLVKTTRPDGSISPHQAGRLVFTKTQYIAVYDVAPAPRPPLPAGGAAKATVDELRATFGGFNAAAGTYEFRNGEVTIRDEVALATGR